MKRLLAILICLSTVGLTHAWWGRHYYYGDPYYYGPDYGPYYGGYYGAGPVSGTLAGVGGIVNSITGL